MYEDLIELDDEIKECLEVETKKKWALLYDFRCCRYGNMTTNLSEIYNHILKSVRGLFITAIVQMIFLGQIIFLLSEKPILKNF